VNVLPRERVFFIVKRYSAALLLRGKPISDHTMSHVAMYSVRELSYKYLDHCCSTALVLGFCIVIMKTMLIIIVFL
jgi:hypothetical protein